MWLTDAVSAIGVKKVSDEIALYSKLASKLESPRDIKNAAMLTAYLESERAGVGTHKHRAAMAKIKNYRADTDWFIQSRAWFFDTLSNFYAFNYDIALQSASEALHAIPETQSNATQEAFVDVNALVSAIYFSPANLEMAAESIEIHIEQAIQAGRSIDGLATLNNFTYALLRWGEYETALKTAQISYSLSAQASQDKQIKAAYRYAQTLNMLDRYPKAELISQRALDMSDLDVWRLNLRLENAVALAGQKKVAQSRQSLETLKGELDSMPKYKARFAGKIPRAEALIAVALGQPQQVHAIMAEKGRIANRRILNNASKETQKLMGTLANDKEVQRAREAELTAANVLQRERIKAQERHTGFMRIIIILLGIIVLGASIWAMRQRAFGRREQALKLRAQSGEKAKRDFLAIMSHELRTPLNGIIGLAEILSREGPTDDVKFKNGVIYKSGLTLLELLTNVLDMSKMDGDKVEIDRLPTRIREITDNIGALWTPEASKKGVTFTLYVADNVPELLNLDPMRTRQCLENLISNAIKFTSEGRVHVHLTYRGAETPDKAGKLTVIIADTGQGMNEEKSAEIFEPFTQADISIRRKFGGSGLGLAITRSLARLMDGDATVVSAPGRGSEFTLTLRAHDLTQNEVAAETLSAALRPTIKERFLEAEARFNVKTQPALPASDPSESINPQPQTAIMAAPPPMPMAAQTMSPPLPVVEPPRVQTGLLSQPAPGALRGLRVLVAEDIETNREVLKIFLRPAGCSVTTANDGKEALECLAREVFDVVLMDVQMPNIDGIEAMTRLRQGGGPNADVPIIALTADVSAQCNARCMAAGAGMFLTKPVVAQDLFSALAISVARKRHAAPGHAAQDQRDRITAA